jgi:hypothetical protein
MTNFLFALILLTTLARSSHAITAYLSYQDSQCLSDGTIQGTLVMSYDDSSYDSMGFDMDYEGECISFQSGEWDLDNWDGSYDNIYDYDTVCATCNGVAGCSTDGTCDNFMTYAGQRSSGGYQLSQSGGSSSVAKEEASTPMLGLANKAKNAAFKEAQSGAATTKTYDGTKAGFVGGIALVGLTVAAVQIVRAKRGKQQIDLSSSEGNYYLSTKDNQSVVV